MANFPWLKKPTLLECLKERLDNALLARQEVAASEEYYRSMHTMYTGQIARLTAELHRVSTDGPSASVACQPTSVDATQFGQVWDRAGRIR